MARIRTIKPDFWTSEQVMECSPTARLMFIGMWNFADDAGRMPFSPKSVKAKVFPADDISADDVRRMILELSSIGLVLIYSVADAEFLQITGWHHQRIDKPQPARYPAPFIDNSANAPGTLPPDRKGKEGKGKEVVDVEERAALESERPPARPLASLSAEQQAAVDLGLKFLQAAGFADYAAAPMGWTDVHYRAAIWISNGWAEDLILAEAKQAMARRTEAPRTVAYFERIFAEAHARAQRPTPIVEIRPGETVHVQDARRQPSGDRSLSSGFAALRQQLHDAENVGDGGDERSGGAGRMLA